MGGKNHRTEPAYGRVDKHHTKRSPPTGAGTLVTIRSFFLGFLHHLIHLCTHSQHFLLRALLAKIEAKTRVEASSRARKTCNFSYEKVIKILQADFGGSMKGRKEGRTDLKLSSDEKFIENVVRLVEIKDDVELAHVAKVTIKHFHEEVYLLQSDELVVVLVYARHKEKGRVPFSAEQEKVWRKGTDGVTDGEEKR